MDPIALRYIRGDTVESVHRASIAVADADGRRVAGFGDESLVTFLRSSAKPFQLVPLVESGAADRFGFSEADLAIMAGSHSGEPIHVRTVQGILERIGVGPEALKCGRHAPYDAAEAERIGSGFTTLHHNCSGKHASMLAVCKDRGWDLETYLEARHPLQRTIGKIVAEECGLPLSRVARAIDGCGIVTFAVPLRSGARAYARLGSGGSGARDAALLRIRDAMMRHPELVAGTGRIDTDLMASRPGDLLVKGGAEACYAAAAPREGWGLLAKIEDGSPRGMPVLLIRALEQLGVLGSKQLKALERHWKAPLRNVAGRAVGHVDCTLRLGPRRTRIRRA